MKQCDKSSVKNAPGNILLAVSLAGPHSIVDDERKLIVKEKKKYQSMIHADIEETPNHFMKRRIRN